MNAHLAEISVAVDRGSHAVLMISRAGWHTAGNLLGPDNITLLPLPPHAPELNPVDKVWQILRNNWLGSRVFVSYAGILNRCCDA